MAKVQISKPTQTQDLGDGAQQSVVNQALQLILMHAKI